MKCYVALLCCAQSARALRAPKTSPLSRTRLRATAAKEPRTNAARWLSGLALSGAALGPVCDNFHSASGVLHYEQYRIALGAAPAWWGGGVLFQTATWVPPLFALAALIIGGLDVLVAKRWPTEEPSGGRVAGAVAAFVALYGLSAVLAAAGLAPATEAAVLWPLALLLWRLCDPAPSSFFAGASTAVGGPAIEAALLGGGGLWPEPFGHLYAYAHPDILGIESWILPVYFAGGPAVSLVSRWIRARA